MDGDAGWRGFQQGLWQLRPALHGDEQKDDTGEDSVVFHENGFDGEWKGEGNGVITQEMRGVAFLHRGGGKRKRRFGGNRRFKHLLLLLGWSVIGKLRCTKLGANGFYVNRNDSLDLDWSGIPSLFLLLSCQSISFSSKLIMVKRFFQQARSISQSLSLYS